MISETKRWRIIDLINWGEKHFCQKGIANSRQEIEWFLCHVLNCKRIDLYIRFEEILLERDLIYLRKIVKRRLSGEPFQHIINKGSFYGRDFIVDKNVLVPRPETEIIIERLKLNGKIHSLLDIGTGSGCIAITASLEGLAENILATDISLSAVNIAEKNMKILKANNIQFAVHDFLLSTFNAKFDVVVSNPPYIGINQFHNLQVEVRNYDPFIALSDNRDGLTFYKKFSNQFDNLLNPNGVLILEFGGKEQKSDIENIFCSNKLITNFYKDLQNQWRVVEVRR
jgi:release factor glutamine methyltransferase